MAESLGVSVDIPPPESFVFARNRVRYILNEIFANPSVAVACERGILQHAIVLANQQTIPKQWKHPLFKKCYEVLFKKVYKNLCELENPRLLERIRSGEIDPEHLAGMMPMDLFPEKWMEIENERIKKQIAGFEITAEGSTDIFECPRCHQRKCKYHEVQTRSADEPMTAFILCLNCGKRWRE
jgi:transcription elongation factor S-II